VLLIHPLLDHPQVIGNSRHISGAYSINELSWDPEAMQLRGTSETVSGDPYMLFVHVPPSYKSPVARASAGAAKVRQGSKPDILIVTFEGQTQPVKWVMDFN